MDASIDSPMFQIAPQHMGKTKALIYLETLLKEMKFPSLNRKQLSRDVVVALSGGDFRFNPADEIERIRQTGAAGNIQFLHDSKEHFLAPALKIAVGGNVPGISCKITSKLGDSVVETNGPGKVGPPEEGLVQEILESRKAFCDNSFIEKIDFCERQYKNYLEACISLMDWFLNRYSQYIREKVADTSPYFNIQALLSKGRMNDRIESWIQTFATQHIDDYKKTTEWGHFRKLKDARNPYTHPEDRVSAFSFENKAAYLNMCRTGIGGLLALFRSYTGFTPNIGVIQQISTAPLVTSK